MRERYFQCPYRKDRNFLSARGAESDVSTCSSRLPSGGMVAMIDRSRKSPICTRVTCMPSIEIAVC